MERDELPLQVRYHIVMARKANEQRNKAEAIRHYKLVSLTSRPLATSTLISGSRSAARA